MPEPPAIAGGTPVREDWLGYGGQDITDAEVEAVTQALRGELITRGPTVAAFEAAVADAVGVDHAVAATSGTAALHLAGAAAGFGPGDEVIVPALTFVSTAHVATYTGATPVFADVDPATRTLDPAAVDAAVTDATAGVVPMHYGGAPADIEGLLAVADAHELTVIWDACHAFGGRWRGEAIGAQRDMAMFSFHPVKNITTGEGGMLVTDDDALAARARRLRSFDMEYAPPGHETRPWLQVAEGVGFNYNMTELQAALGLAQLERLDAFRARRAAIVARYDAAFADIAGIRTPPQPADAVPMWHLYAIEVTDAFGCDRAAFVRAMHAEQIGVQVHYVPLHEHPVFAEVRGADALAGTEAVYAGLVSLPLHTTMTDADVASVIAAVERLAAYTQEASLPSP